MEKLTYFMVELDRPGGGWGGLPQLNAQARDASEVMTREGTPIRFVRSIFVPEDETCFYVYQARSVDDVRLAADRAGLTFDRICEAVATPEGVRQ